MRNVKRIWDFCARLCACWQKVPDMRFGQLVLIVLGQYVLENDGRDFFYVEDEDLIGFFERCVDELADSAYQP